MLNCDCVLQAEKEPEECERPLLPWRPPCSVTTALLSLGCLLLLLCGGWFLATMFWLKTPSIQEPHRPPPPARATTPDSQGRTGVLDRAAGSAPDPQTCSSIPEAWRFDCYPERGVVVTREMCEARNCCFIPASSSSPPGRNGVPWCFYPPGFPSYSLVALNDTALGQKGSLVRKVKTYYPGDIFTLEVDVRHETETRLRVRVS